MDKFVKLGQDMVLLWLLVALLLREILRLYLL